MLEIEGVIEQGVSELRQEIFPAQLIFWDPLRHEKTRAQNERNQHDLQTTHLAMVSARRIPG